MSAGDEMVISEGVYSCGTCYDSYFMFALYGLYGKIRCEEDNLGCKLDAEGSSRGVVFVEGTGGGTLTLQGLHILKGRYAYGGGLAIDNGGIVVI